jgi:hypothetical protein
MEAQEATEVQEPAAMEVLYASLQEPADAQPETFPVLEVLSL